MATIHRITKNTFFLVASNVIGKFITFFYILIAARYLGVADFGALSFALAFTSIFTVLADLGLSKLQIREIARDKSNAAKITTNILLLKFFLGAVTLLLMAIVINLMGYPQEIVVLVYITGLSVVFTNFGVSFESLFQGFERMGYLAVAHILTSLIMLVGALFITTIGAGLTEFALLYLIAGVAVAVFELIISIKNFIAFSKDIDIDFCKRLLKDALPFAMSDMFLVMYLRFDSVIMSKFQGDVAVGLYSASYKLVDSLNLIYFSFMAALFPVTSRLFKYSKEKLMLSFEKSLKYLLSISLPIAVGTTIFADEIIKILYGAEYTPSVIVLQILVWSAAFVFTNTALSNLLQSINKQAVVAKQNAIAALINLVVNLMLIPQYSYVGASIASVVTQAFSFAYLYISVSKTEFRIPNKVFLNLLSKVVFASMVMGLFAACLKPIGIFFVVPLSVVVYFLSFYLIGGIDSYDISVAKKLVDGLFKK